MNFKGFEFDENTKQTLNALDVQGRIPHAVIIESKDKTKSFELAKFLSMYAVCNDTERPCGQCGQCRKAFNAAHADIKYAYPEKKSKSYSIDQMREISKDAYIKPNEAAAKVYIFEDAENRLSPIVQNAFLKLLEEPPQNVLFILLCENSKKLLATILSRSVVLRLKTHDVFSDTACENARGIVKGILSAREYDLLKALNVLLEKDSADETLLIVKLIFRDGLAAVSGVDAVFDAELGKSLATRFTKARIIQMIEITENAKIKITQNININLLTTWLCGEYRRISWQR